MKVSTNFPDFQSIRDDQIVAGAIALGAGMLRRSSGIGQTEKGTLFIVALAAALRAVNVTKNSPFAKLHCNVKFLTGFIDAVLSDHPNRGISIMCCSLLGKVSLDLIDHVASLSEKEVVHVESEAVTA